MPLVSSKFCELDVGLGTQSLKMFAYRGTTETLAEIGEPGFFDTMRDYMRVSDIVFAHGSDGDALLTVSQSNDSEPYIWTESYKPLTNTIKTVGTHNTVGGGVNEVFAVSGVKTTDHVFTQLLEGGASSPLIYMADIPADNQIRVIFNTDPLNDTYLSYVVISGQY